MNDADLRSCPDPQEGKYPAPVLEAAGELFKVLGAPLRLTILVKLSKAARTVSELVTELGVNQPLVSQHLRILRDARLVTASRSGHERLYRLADEHVSHIVTDALRHVEEHI